MLITNKSPAIKKATVTFICNEYEVYRQFQVSSISMYLMGGVFLSRNNHIFSHIT